MTRPLVTVITPTFRDRFDLLSSRCVPSVDAQTYPTIEHVIVSDGPCPGLASFNGHGGGEDCRYFRRTVELGFDTMAFFENKAPSVGQILVGSLLARGEYQCVSNDDNVMEPTYIEELVAALEHDGTDFAYSQIRMVNEDNGHEWTLGSDAPQCGNISAFMVYKRDCLKMALRRFGQYPEDWDWISRLINAGARWSYVPKVLYTQHYSQKADAARFDPPRIGHPLLSWGAA